MDTFLILPLHQQDGTYHRDPQVDLCAPKIYGVLRCNYSGEDPFLIFKLPIQTGRTFVYQIIKVVRIEIRCHKWAKKVKSRNLSHGNPKIITTGWTVRKVYYGFFVEG